MTTTVLPTSSLVAKAWLKSIPGVVNAGLQLPSDESSWAADGFVQYGVVGGSPDLYSPISEPVYQLDFWGVNVNSAKAPWEKTGNLAQRVWLAGFDQDLNHMTLELPNNAGSVRVLSAYLMSEPRPVFGSTQDEGQYARLTADLRLTWVA